MIQIKMLKDMKNMLKNHLYNVDEKTATLLVSHGCIKNPDGEYKMGTGDLAVYYSKDRDELDGTFAPVMNIPEQLRGEYLLRVNDDKQPIDLKWPDSTNTLDNVLFTEWIISHEKYGVLCGGPHKLCVIDFDDPQIQQSVLDDKILPPTFTVRTAKKKLLHLYYFIIDGEIKSGPIKNEDKRTLVDIQFERRQVIGPGSRIASGQTYDVVNDVPITRISANLIHKALDRYNFTHTQEALQEAAGGLNLDDFRPKYNDTSLSDIKQQLKISDVLREAGISAKGGRGNTRCPFHDSVGGKCLSYDDNKDGGLWKCFNCDRGGDLFTLWMEVHNISDFVEAKKQLCEKLGIEDTYVPPPVVEPIPNAKPNIQLPQDNRTVLDFAADLAIYFKDCPEIFFKVDEECIVEIREYDDVQLKRTIVGFSEVSPARLFNIIEWKVNTYTLQRVKRQDVIVRKSASEQIIKLVAANEAFLRCLHEIKRFLNYPIPFIDKNNELIIPRKGYDSRYKAYFTPNTPELTLMPVEAAKELLYDVIKEFCFKEPIDRIIALSYIITPMCRGLYHTSTARTPLYIISANRERAGKDYLAGVVGMLYEGRAIENTPFVTSDYSDTTDEWRKKFTSALKAGMRRIHSSNNRGFLNSAVLEQFLTSEVWTDRQLGGNITLDLNNEMDVSLSANIGLSYTPDLWFRSRPIHLFYSEENPNDRVYERTDLWGYVLENRGRILSAIYTLINAWFTAGSPKSSIPFTSFPEWARVVGGIMEYNGMGNPCVLLEDEGIGGDSETKDMKELFRFMAEYSYNHPENKGYTIGDIRKIILEAQSNEDYEGFPGWDLRDNKSHQTKFGIILRRFVGRYFNCRGALGHYRVTLEVAVPNERSTRMLYMFKIDLLEGKPFPERHNPDEPELVEENLNASPEKITEGDKLMQLLNRYDVVAIDFLITEGIPQSVIQSFKLRGIIFEPKAGYVGLFR